jgi:hypothetical protein
MRRLLVAVSLLALVAPAASAAPRLKPVRAGKFSMRVPVAWKAQTNVGTIALIAASTKPEGGFFTNANVIAGAPRAGAPITQWRTDLVAQLRRAGLVVGKPRSRVVRLPAGRAVEIAFGGSLSGRKLRWLTYAYDAGAKAYILTFTTAASQYARNAPLFRRLSRTVRIRR